MSSISEERSNAVHLFGFSCPKCQSMGTAAPCPPPDPPHIQRFRILPPFFILYSQPLNRFIAIESIITVRSPKGRASVLNLPMTVLPTSRSDKRDIEEGAINWRGGQRAKKYEYIQTTSRSDKRDIRGGQRANKVRRK